MSALQKEFTFHKGFLKTKTLSITSGKGGVGKTTLVANLAVALGQSGAKVLILDGDMGMANVDIMFGIRSRSSIEDVFNGEQSLNSILQEVAPNVFLIPGGSGIYNLHRLDFVKKQILLDQVSELDRHFNFMLIDTAPGIGENVLYLNSAAQEILVVVTPDPASITDAYALIKVLSLRHAENKFGVVVNLVRDEAEALFTYRRLAEVADRFLCVSLDLKGFILNDPSLRQATKKQQLVVTASPGSESSLGLLRLAEKVNGLGPVRELKGGLQFFWQQLSGVA